MNNYILCVLVCPHLQVDDTSLTKNFYVDRCGRCRSFSYCGQSHQKLDWRAGHKQECGASGEQRINVKWAMGEGLLVMEEEPLVMEEEPGTEEVDDQEEQRLRSMLEMGDSVEAGEEEWDEIEKGQKEDKVMEKFKKRLRRCPDQVLKYERRGRPLECSAQPLQPPPACQKCGDQRSFELSQLSLVQIKKFQCPLNRKFPEFFKTLPTFNPSALLRGVMHHK